GLDKVEQVRHLFEIRRHVGVVAGEVDVVELDFDDVLDGAVVRVELAAIGGWLGRRSRGRRGERGREHRHSQGQRGRAAQRQQPGSIRQAQKVHRLSPWIRSRGSIPLNWSVFESTLADDLSLSPPYLSARTVACAMSDAAASITRTSAGRGKCMSGWPPRYRRANASRMAHVDGMASPVAADCYRPWSA